LKSYSVIFGTYYFSACLQHYSKVVKAAAMCVLNVKITQNGILKIIT